MMMRNIHYKGRYFNRLRKHPQPLLNRKSHIFKSPLYLIDIDSTDIRLPKLKSKMNQRLILI